MLVNEILLKIIEKPKERNIFSALESYNTCMVGFDLWMSRTRMHTFVLIVHFLNDKLGALSCNHWFFLDSWDFQECHGFSSQWSPCKTWAQRLGYCVCQRWVGSSFNHDHYIDYFVSCEVLWLTTPFVGACWGHAMSKCCQYATDDYKICVGLTSISIKEAQSIL